MFDQSIMRNKCRIFVIDFVKNHIPDTPNRNMLIYMNNYCRHQLVATFRLGVFVISVVPVHLLPLAT